MILFLLLILVSLFLQTITTIPIVLTVLLMSYIFSKESWVFLAAFLSGILLDVITLGTLGESSLFFILFLFLVDLYEKKFEIQTLSFVLLSSFFGSLGYLLLFGYNAVLITAIASTCLSAFFFVLTHKRKKGKQSVTIAA